MAITRPVTRTIISTTDFGIPVADQINALQTAVAAVTPEPWQPFALVNGFANEVGFAPSGYRKRNSTTLEFRGSVTGIPASGITMATLPAGYRPTQTYRLAALCYSGTQNTSFNVRTDISSAGVIQWYDLPAGALFLILTGLMLPLN